MGLRFVNVLILVSVVLSGCGIDPTVNLEIQKKSDKMLAVTTTNFQTGALALLDLENRTAKLDFAPIFPDAVLRSFSGASDIFVINRLGADNIQRVDRFSGKTLQQFSVGLGSNPQDLIVVGENAYISCFQSQELLKVDLATGKVIKKISLAAFSDADGSPEATRMELNGEELWLILQQLDQSNSYVPVGPAKIGIADINTDEIRTVIPLIGTNPVTAFKKMGSDVWLIGNAGQVGSRSQMDGGVEAIDINKKTSLGFITTEAKLGGDLVDVECIDKKACLAIVSKPETELVVFDPVSGAKIRSLWLSSGYHLRQILRDKDDGLIYVADGNPYDPKIRVWSEANFQERIDLNWNMSLPPYHMEFLY
ncbi:hypothetical protein EBT16_03900 [bacterium]|nr:hypothetical protein [bacterium]